jgi:hypothetical protein
LAAGGLLDTLPAGSQPDKGITMTTTVLNELEQLLNLICPSPLYPDEWLLLLVEFGDVHHIELYQSIHALVLAADSHEKNYGPNTQLFVNVATRVGRDVVTPVRTIYGLDTIDHFENPWVPLHEVSEVLQ